MTTEPTSPERKTWLRRRIPLLLVLGLGLFVWKNGFGLLATERTLEWRLPVAYADLRHVELQLWRGEVLLKREERVFSEGLSSSLENTVPLTRGLHRAVSVVQLRDGTVKTLTTTLDPQNHSTVVVDFRAGGGTVDFKSSWAK